jgi:hypothetical protein
MNNPDQPAEEFDLDNYTVQKLEVIEVELHNFLNSEAYKLFTAFCKHQKETLYDTALTASLRDVSALFTRESLFGESLSWKRMTSLFPELLEEITANTHKRTK